MRDLEVEGDVRTDIGREGLPRYEWSEDISEGRGCQKNNDQEAHSGRMCRYRKSLLEKRTRRGRPVASCHIDSNSGIV